MNHTADLVEPWQFGKVRKLREGKTHCIFTYGVIIKMALSVAEELAAQGISSSVIAIPTLKPLDTESLTVVLQAYSSVSRIDEGVPRALGLEIESLAHRKGYQGKVDTLALRYEFIHCYGSPKGILQANDLTERLIMEGFRHVSNDKTR